MTVQVKKALIPVAGLGTRFLPATKTVPKEMLAVVDRPAIHYIFDEIAASGFDEVVLITSHTKKAIEDYLDRSPELESFLEQSGKSHFLEEVNRLVGLFRLVSVRQGKPQGLGHAVLAARRVVEDDPFAVILPDDLIDARVPALRQMVDCYEKYDGPVVSLMRVKPSEAGKYGIVAGEKVGEGVYRIDDLVEKPPAGKAPSDLAVIGRYILTPDLWEILEATEPGANGEIQLTDALRVLAKKRPLYGCVFEGTRFDAGDKLGYLTAVVNYALKHPVLGETFRAHLKGLSL